jgi:hypothetical protein
MANQLTIWSDSAREAIARSRVLAVAAAAGIQFLAITAAAQDEVGSGSESVPILVPEQVVVIALAAAAGGLVGAVIGVFATRRSGGKKKDDE